MRDEKSVIEKSFYFFGFFSLSFLFPVWWIGEDPTADRATTPSSGFARTPPSLMSARRTASSLWLSTAKRRRFVLSLSSSDFLLLFLRFLTGMLCIFSSLLLIQKWHPDRWTRNPAVAGEAKRRFQHIQEAYSGKQKKKRENNFLWNNCIDGHWFSVSADLQFCLTRRRGQCTTQGSTIPWRKKTKSVLSPWFFLPGFFQPTQGVVK